MTWLSSLARVKPISEGLLQAKRGGNYN